jgi:hypothetical protein
VKSEKILTAIPEEPFNNKDGTQAGSKDGSFCELSKFGAKSTCQITNSSINGWRKNSHTQRKTSTKGVKKEIYCIPLQIQQEHGFCQRLQKNKNSIQR